MKDVNGVMTALITPFTPEGAIDEKGLKVLIDRQIEAGIKGICVVAGSGEYVNLTPEEREKVVKLSVQYADNKIYVISGVLKPTQLLLLRVLGWLKETELTQY